jgi:RHS repeat-associated protein
VSNELTATSNATYGYDPNGNAISKNDSSGGTTYAWDFENRMTSVTLPGTGGTVTFKYDPFGRRIYKSSGSGSSIYAYDNLIEETNTSGRVVARYAQTENAPCCAARRRATITPMALAPSLRYPTQRARWPRLTRLTRSANKPPPVARSLTRSNTPAREFDTDTNLQFSRARYYDPANGRFLSEDPTGFKNGTNFYPCVTNDPVNGTVLDAARNDTLWVKAKETVINKTGSLTVEGLKIALSTLIKHALGG